MYISLSFGYVGSSGWYAAPALITPPVRFDLPLRSYMQMQEAPSENPAGGNIFKQALKIHVQHKV